VSEWSLLNVWIVNVPSIGPDGQTGPAGRLIVASEARAIEVASAHPSRSWRKATEADLAPTELANLRRAAAEASP
jgi:hypothetical protein